MMNLDGYIPWFSDVKAKLLDRASDIQFGDLDQTLRRICAVFEGYFLHMRSNHEKSIDLRKKHVFFSITSMLWFGGFRSSISFCVCLLQLDSL